MRVPERKWSAFYSPVLRFDETLCYPRIRRGQKFYRPNLKDLDLCHSFHNFGWIAVS